MRTFKYLLLTALLAAFLLIPPLPVLAQDDETPEQKKLIQTLEERERIAAEEQRSAAPAVDSPEADLMKEKEADRANIIREEERDEERGETDYQGRYRDEYER